MFNFLKKKIISWIGSDSKSHKTAGKSKGKKTEKEKKENKLKKLTKKERKTEKEVENIIKEAESPVEEEMRISEEEKGNFFTKLIKKISVSKLSQEEFDKIFQEFEIILLENNVALEAVDKIKASLEKDLVNQQIKKTEAEARVIQSLKDALLSVLVDPPNLIENIRNAQGVFTIIFFGINGTGKTTTVTKLANLLKNQGINCVLAAADTFRAASIEQLKVHGERLNIPVINQEYGSDPAAVAFDAKRYAEKHGIKVVLIDTAGRMYTKDNLLKEMEKIIRVSKPDLKIFVGESITGNDMISQCKTFNDIIGIDGIILTKSDIDERGGAIISISCMTNKPVYYLGVGQNMEDLEIFSKNKVLKNLGLE